MRRRPSLRARLEAIPPRRLVVFLDYDGTLTPIVRRPKEARLKVPVRRTLGRLARLVPVVIVSGRALSDLRRLVGVAGVRYVAHHGLVYKEPGSTAQWLGQRISRREVREWARALQSAAKGVPGALVEDKGISMALHNRLVRSADHRTDFGAFRVIRNHGFAVLVGGRRGIAGADRWMSGPRSSGIPVALAGD